MIAIIGILAALVIASVGATRKKAHQARCVANLRQVGVAIIAYSDEHKGMLPGTTETANCLQKGAKSVYYNSDWCRKRQLSAYLAPYLGSPDSMTLGSGVYVDIPLLRCPSRTFPGVPPGGAFLMPCQCRISSNVT